MSESFNVNGLNQVVAAALGTIGYDARGNTTSAGSKTYTYDIFNQLTGVNGSGSNATMTYDPLLFPVARTRSSPLVGRMAQVTSSAVTTKFVYSGSQMIAETNSSGTTLRRYVHGPGMDEPIVWYEGTGTTTRKWFVADNLGSITGITDASGNVTNKNTYSEYGVPATGNTGRFQYTGQVWLAEAQIYHYKARAYDPYLGRFLQTDPIGYAAGMNMYAYVSGDPVNYRDPYGLKRGCVPTKTGISCPQKRPSSGIRWSHNRFPISIYGAFFAAADGGGGGGGAGTEEGENCEHSVDKFITYALKELGSRGANDEFLLLGGLGKLSSAITNYKHVTEVSSGGRLGLWSHPTTNNWANWVSSQGFHETNIRFEFGVHLSTESKRKGYFIHLDYYDGTRGIKDAILHMQEAGILGDGINPRSRFSRASQTFSEYCNGL